MRTINKHALTTVKKIISYSRTGVTKISIKINNVSTLIEMT